MKKINFFEESNRLTNKQKNLTRLVSHTLAEIAMTEVRAIMMANFQ
jgi:hypothetical protein